MFDESVSTASRFCIGSAAIVSGRDDRGIDAVALGGLAFSRGDAPPVWMRLISASTSTAGAVSSRRSTALRAARSTSRENGASARLASVHSASIHGAYVVPDDKPDCSR